jgi:hypothetical protein
MPPHATASPAIHGRRRISFSLPWASVGLACIIVTWAYLAPLWSLPARTSPRPSDYYGFLTEAFHSGQMHLNISVDPQLLMLKNPYAGPQGTERPHDMTYYQGRFYLYYGATPVLLVYLPWRGITGTYLYEHVGTRIMLFGTFALAALWLIRAHRRWFSNLSPFWTAFLILTIGFSPPLYTEIDNVTFYLVPIASACFCLMLAFLCADLALTAHRPPTQATWLALASLGWGLAVASRPIYILGLPLLAMTAFYLWRQQAPCTRWCWPALRLTVAAVIPAALVGTAMMFYNYMRFGHPFEFGIRFSMASADIRDLKMMGVEFIPKNLSLYLLQSAAFIRYFPFIMTGGSPIGVLPHLPFVALAFLCPISWFFFVQQRASLVLAGLLLLGASLANFSLLCLFFGGEERYLLDFVPPALLLAATTAAAMLCASQRNRFLHIFTGVTISLLATYSILTGLALGFSRKVESPERTQLKRWLNWPAHLLEQLNGTQHGPVELTVSLPLEKIGTTEPLITTGYDRHGADAISIHYVDDRHVRFSAFHLGRGGPTSKPIPVDYDKPHRIRITMGSLYPPPEHPLFSDWSPTQVSRVRRQLKIELDGQTVLQGNFTVYPSTPAGVWIGRSQLGPGVSTETFTGQIHQHRRLGLDLPGTGGYTHTSGPVRITFQLPPRYGDEGLPIVSTGKPSAGDLVFVQQLADGYVRFGHDSFGSGAVFTPAVQYDARQDQVVDVEMGSLYPPEDPRVSATNRRRLRITLNGTRLINTSRIFSPSEAEDVEFGFNTIMASTAIDYFPGAIRKIESIPNDPTESTPGKWGPLRLGLVFPITSGPSAEPILVTGHAGQADILFVRYEANGNVRFGIDHWGVGIAESDSLPLNRNQTHLLEIYSAALLPPANHPSWQHAKQPAEQTRGRFEILLNGKTILIPPFQPYTQAEGSFDIGKNTIGASSCQPEFNGKILLLERLPW